MKKNKKRHHWKTKFGKALWLELREHKSSFIVYTGNNYGSDSSFESEL